MEPRPLLVVLLATASLAAAGIPPGPLGDAGTGSDAGDSPADATSLPAEGTYNGTLLPPGDADWYELDTGIGGSVCYQVVVEGPAIADGILAPNDALEPNITRTSEAGHVLDLGLAIPASSSSTRNVFFGLVPSDAGRQPVDSAGAYTFDIQALTPTEVVASNAGGDRASAVETEGPCVAGNLGPEDDADAYVFELSAGERVAISLANGPTGTQLALTSPSGEEVAQIGSGGFEDVLADETGEWLLTAELPTDASPAMDSDYLVGLSVNGPEPRPCKPGCSLSVG